MTPAITGPDPHTVRLCEHLKAFHGVEVVAGDWGSVERLHGHDHDMGFFGDSEDHCADHDRVWPENVAEDGCE